jgi:threonine synthase
MWRYRTLLPIAGDTPVPPLNPGGTPLDPAPRLRSELVLPNLWLKDDTRNPSGSLKDRPSNLAVAKAIEAGFDTVATASSGNAAASLGAACASAGLRCVVFVPPYVRPGKLAQLQAYGAEVLIIEGRYEDAFDLCTAACEAFGWYNRNTGYNPYMVEGKKTVSLEIAEQLGWRSPDVVTVPVGDGCIISGVAKGFRDLHELGIIDREPRLFAVQAAGSDPFVRALEGEPPSDREPETIADGIAGSSPRNGVMALRDVRRSGGGGVRVTDDAMLEAEMLIGRTTGIFAEPSAAASVAGIRRLRELGLIGDGDEVVALLTGSGLKAVDVIAGWKGRPEPIPPSLDAVRARTGTIRPR